MANKAKHLTALLVACFFLVIPAYADDLLDAGATFLLHSRRVFAHGCAVNGYTLTSAHVVDPRNAASTNPLPPMAFRYEFRGVHAGLAKSVSIVVTSDIAVLSLSGVPPVYAELGPSPKVGDRIRWVEYDWRRRNTYMNPRAREAKVVGIWGGMIVLDRPVTTGGSGGCAFNDAGQAVGLMTWYDEPTDEETKGVGGVVGFWGGWWHSLRLLALPPRKTLH